MMKKALAIIALGGFIIMNSVADEAGQSWARLYRRLPDIKQKYAVLQNLTPMDDRSLESFYLDSLNDLVYGNLSQFRTDRATYDDWEILTRTIVRELGEIKGQTASDVVWDVARTAEVPLLKSEALIALGRMRAVEYAEPIAVMLRNLNFNTRSDREAAEIEAYGAVVALDKMKDPIGFEPLFYASIGWYSNRVTGLAEQALLELGDDPMPPLTGILMSAADYRVKRSALNLGLRTDVPDAGKSDIAAAALSEGLKYSESDPTRIRQLAELRTDAVNGMIRFGVPEGDAPRLLNQAVDEGELDEKLFAIQALGRSGGDDATGYLAERLSFYNDRQASGLALSREELTIVRQIIFSLGESGNRLGLEPLAQMAFLDYTPSLIRDSKSAIEKIEGQ